MSEKFTSTPTMIRALFRMMESKDSPRLCNFSSIIPGAATAEDAVAHGRISDPVLNFLMRLDRKLDTIISFFQKEGLERDFPYKARVTHISPLAFTMECTEPLAPGDHVEAILFLEEIPMNIVSCVAVVEKKLPDKAVSGPGYSAFTFTVVSAREEEREAIIRHVFQVERKLIREQKSDKIY